MPLEIKGFVSRPRAIFLTGETVTVKIILKNNSKREKENLAWGSVQLVSERIFGAQTTAERPTTAISKSAYTVYSSLPIILFCDLHIGPGEQKQFKTEIYIPEIGVPPSYRGHFIRYLSKIKIAVQHVRAPIKVMHIPVRIIPSVAIESKQDEHSNPFITNPNTSISEVVSSMVDQMTAPRKPYSFSMTNPNGRVTFLTLYKKIFRLGEEIVGHLDFRDADVTCIQYSVYLETVELLTEASNTETEADNNNQRSKITEVSHCHEVCAYTKDGTFRLAIPMQGYPTFYTDNVHLKWRMRFEFATAKSLVEPQLYGLSSAPLNIDVETLSWSVDVFVLPCSPENASLTDSTYSGEVTMTL